MGSSASKGAMWLYMAEPPKESGQADFRYHATVVGIDVHLLVLDGVPQPFHQDLVIPGFLSDQVMLILLAFSRATKSVEVN